MAAAYVGVDGKAHMVRYIVLAHVHDAVQYVLQMMHTRGIEKVKVMSEAKMCLSTMPFSTFCSVADKGGGCNVKVKVILSQGW